VKMGVLQFHIAPEDVRRHLSLNAARITSYKMMKDEIEAFVQADDGADGVQPMDIGAIEHLPGNKKGKGKGKGDYGKWKAPGGKYKGGKKKKGGKGKGKKSHMIKSTNFENLSKGKKGKKIAKDLDIKPTICGVVNLSDNVLITVEHRYKRIKKF